jgi:PAS domain S-box-containing protein
MPENLIPSSAGNKSDKSITDQATPQGTDPDFKEFVHDSPIAIYSCDRQGYITYFNEAAVKLWGRRPEIGRDLWCSSWKIYYPNGSSMPPDACPMARTLKEGLPFKGAEIIIELPDHNFRRLLVFTQPVFDERNTITGAHNTLVDITAQMQNEEKQAILTAIVESSDDGIISKNLEGIITSWNTGARRIFGYTEEETIGKHISLLIPETLLQEEDMIISNIRSGKKIDHYETTRMAKDGREIPISLTISPVKDSLGRIIGASKIARDISERLNAEQVINQSLYRLNTLNSIGKAIFENLDVQSVLQKVTDATTKLTGAAFGAFFYNTLDEHGESYMLFTLSGAPREAFEQFGMPRNTDVFRATFLGEGVVRSADITKDPRYGHNAPHKGMPKGHLPVVSYLAVPVTSNSGAVIGGLFFGHPDAGVFTEEHEDLVSSIVLQAAIAIDNSKLFEEVKALSAKKDEFIALASHELKTPLTTIKGYLQVVERSEKEPVSKLFINKTLNQVEKLNALVSDLLDVSRIEAGKLRLDKMDFDLRELLLEIIESLQYTNKTHRVMYHDDEQPVEIRADRQRLEQALLNLLTNAIKYSPKADHIEVWLETTDGEVTVKIKDMGIGLSDAQQKKLFTRFYRAEGAVRIAGLGLGLYLTKDIIDRHQGRIGVSSEPGKGSTFFFSLPIK